MPNFVQIGQRVLNLDLVCGAERQGRGKVSVYLASGGAGGPMRWDFEDQGEADTLWLKLASRRGDLTDLAGGPYSISDNEQTESIQDVDRDRPTPLA